MYTNISPLNLINLKAVKQNDNYNAGSKNKFSSFASCAASI